MNKSAFVAARESGESAGCMSCAQLRRVNTADGSANASSPDPSRTTPAPSLRPLLTIEQVATYLCVNAKTVRRWVAKRRIPCVRIGTRLRFDYGDIVSWVRQRKED